MTKFYFFYLGRLQKELVRNVLDIACGGGQANRRKNVTFNDKKNFCSKMVNQYKYLFI